MSIVKHAGLIQILVLLVSLIGGAGYGAIAQNTSLSSPGLLEAEFEIASALYAASATQEAVLRAADQRLRTQRAQIKELRCLVQKGEAAAENLARMELEFIEELAARDASYAREIAVFRDGVEDIASTPEGLRALALFNNGDEIGAIAILDDLRAANDAARAHRLKLESAEDARVIADMASRSSSQGRISKSEIIVRYEEIISLDASQSDDWIALARLYLEAGRVGAAEQSARNALAAAQSKAQRWAAHDKIGDIHVAKADRAIAIENYEKSLEIALSAEEVDAQDAIWLRRLILTNVKLAETKNDSEHYLDALMVARSLEFSGDIMPAVHWMLSDLEDRSRATQ